MNQELEKLARTLVQSGIAASESEAKRMAESMVSTESKVQTGFDDKKESETRYGNSPRTPKNPVDGTPVKSEPLVEQAVVKTERKRDFSEDQIQKPVSPEEYSAQRLNVAMSFI